MIIDNIKNKYPKIVYLLLSSLIFVLIAKSYLFFVYVVNLKGGIPNNINFVFVWAFRIFLLSLILFIKWDLYDAVFLIIGIVVTLLTKNSLFLAFFVMGIYCRKNNISNEYLVKNYLFMTAIFFLGMILLNLFKILPNGVNVHYRGDSIRNDFGFGNPNTPFLASLPLYAGYLYLRFDKYEIYDRLLLLTVSFIIYFQTYSRTGLMTILTILLFIEIVKRVDIRKNKIITLLLTSLPIIITGLSFFTAKFLNTYFFNEILSHRPETWDIYIRHINFFRNQYYYTLLETYPLDNSYIFSFVLYGILFTTLLLILYTYYMRKNILENNAKMIAICSIFLIYSFGENILFNIGLNFTLILAISSISLRDFFGPKKSIFQKR
ncbi:hypothetical protein SDC9_89065 [bioreactor metagenome]|uniref:Polysaccharide polymerase n=1 Tax=bioreactor metagenome TaxID=1076179 RepID=A0A644ZN81_9ZZZZ